MKRTISILCVLASMATSVALAADEAPAAKAAPPPPKAAPAIKAAPAAKAAKKSAKAAPAKKIAKAPLAKKIAPPAALPVARIVERNIAARGGLAAWRAVSSLTMSGVMDAGGKQDAKLPFVMRMKRPQKSRLELEFREQTAVQVWDGKEGWKVRPYLNRNEVEPYTAAEARSAAAAAELDGPLVDFERKGTKVVLAGTEVVEGRYTYKLELTPKSGGQIHLWIDAKTFLEAKIDGEPRRIDGRMRKVTVFYRDFKPVDGLQFPRTMETVVERVEGSHRMTIRTIKVNPPLDDSLFAKPRLGSVMQAAR